MSKRNNSNGRTKTFCLVTYIQTDSSLITGTELSKFVIQVVRCNKNSPHETFEPVLGSKTDGRTMVKSTENQAYQVVNVARAKDSMSQKGRRLNSRRVKLPRGDTESSDCFLLRRQVLSRFLSHVENWTIII